MPGIQDLLALAQGAGGGGAPPQGAGPPPPGGGAPPMGGMIQQVLGQLMQDPNAMKAMQAYAMNMMGGAGGAPPMAQPPGNAQGGPPGMPPQQDMPPGMAPDNAGGPPDDAEAMAQGQIDKSGATFDGQDAPTQNDIERLVESPTDTMVEAFDEKFGDGAAAKYINQGDEEKGEPANNPPGEEASE